MVYPFEESPTKFRLFGGGIIMKDKYNREPSDYITSVSGSISGNELSPLEAFNKITSGGCKGKYHEYCEIIETALKEHELMKQAKFIVADKDISNEDLERLKNQRMFVSDLGQCEIKPLFDEETKKALEIIKEKFVIPAYIMNTENVEEYNKWLRKITFRKDYQKRALTKEEYDLLKEVLK